MEKLKEIFETIKWPTEFVVKFKDGQEQVFVSSQGVFWDDGNDLEGMNENRPFISCCWRKKSPSQQNYRRIEFFIDEVTQFKSLDGSLIWQPGA